MHQRIDQLITWCWLSRYFYFSSFPYFFFHFCLIYEQIIEIISFIIFWSMSIISMGNGQPVSTVMGYDSCVIYYTTICIHNWAQVMGGFGMALYRLQCIKTPTRRVPSKWFVIGHMTYVGIGLGIGKKWFLIPYHVHIQPWILVVNQGLIYLLSEI